MAPTFGVEGMFGTNPLTVGIPTDEDFDFLIDCATSITQNGKIEYYARIGEDVHPGTVIGRDGQPISGDSGEALKKIRSGDAALTTLGGIGEALGGYSYGYAMVIELLSAVLQDGAYGKDLDGKDENGNIRPYHLGHFFIAIDTDHFLGQELTRKKPAKFSAVCVPLKKRRAPTAFSPPAKKSGRSGSSARTAACPSTTLCRKKFWKFGTNWV